MRRPVSLDCIRHHPVPSNQVISSRVQIGRLCRDLRDRFRVLLVSARVWCLWRSISVAPSPHPKIPFLADKAQAPDIRLVAGEPDLGGVGIGGDWMQKNHVPGEGSARAIPGAFTTGSGSCSDG
jgi:hypothetical protein